MPKKPIKEQIFVGFSTTKKFNIIASLIHFFEQRPYSHVYVRIPSQSLGRDLIYEASGLSVHFNSKNSLLSRSKIIKEYAINVSPGTKVKVLQFAIDNLEKPYGGLQLVGMIWVILCRRFGWKHAKNPFHSGFICSELVAAVLKELGYTMPEDLNSVGPREVDDILKTLQDSNKL